MGRPESICYAYCSGNFLCNVAIGRMADFSARLSVWGERLK